MAKDDIIPHLFRTEFSRITAVLCRTFGLEHIELAEDIASETFMAALETWTYRGVPENPTAWLYTVAKNKTRNQLARQKVYSGKIVPQIQPTEKHAQIEIDLSESNITDSQLQMLFAICQPTIPQEAQIGLALRILCGFGADEIANAFLTNRETINKRLWRAKEKLREDNVKIEMPAASEIQPRLQTVMATLYLLFNEGYYSESNDSVLREELCLEAMRLNYFLLQNETTALPPVFALMSLMCFHASRFAARKNDNGEVVLYEDQDENLWNKELITQGAYYLHQASKGDILSQYHIEANIAYWHTIKEDSPVKWENILQLYNRLLQINYSPIAALNRTFAYSKVYGNEMGIVEAEKLKQLECNHYYFTLVGVLNMGINKENARSNFEKALVLAKTNTDKKTIQKKLDDLNESQ